MTESNVRQRLAAILAADAVGYTRLMQDDERATVAALDQSRLIFRDHIAAEGGRVVDTAGDSVLATFETAIGAVRAALAVQDQLAERNAPEAESRRMRFRIGVTLGDIIEKPDGTIYGDGVNIAARLEAEADPGTVVISGSAFDSVRGKIDVGFADLGEHAVKNIDAPVRMFRVETGAVADQVPPPKRRLWPVLAGAFVGAAAIAAIVVWQVGDFGTAGDTAGDAARFAPALPTGPSIAVLPFKNQSDDDDQAYFSDGLTEDVIAALGRFSNMSVIARNTTERYRDTNLTPVDIGRELGVAYLLDGSVRRAGNRVRVSVQLTDTSSGLHLWSDRYDRDFEDLFAVQDDITRNVAGTLAVELTRVESERAAAKPTDSLEAYDYVLRGWETLRQHDRASNAAAREMFQQAVELDPNYADAYAGWSASYVFAVNFGYVEFIPKALEQAKDLAAKALTLDTNSIRARGMLAMVHMHERDFDLAASEFRRVLEINPSDASSYSYYGTVLLFSGHAKEAITWLEAAMKLDPNTEGRALADLAVAYYLIEAYDKTVATAREAINRDPDAYVAHMILPAAYGQLGQTENATEAIREVLRVRPFFSIGWFTTAFPDPNDAAHIAAGWEKTGFQDPGG